MPKQKAEMVYSKRSEVEKTTIGSLHLISMGDEIDFQGRG
jgi:hypothetical protein